VEGLYAFAAERSKRGESCVWQLTICTATFVLSFTAARVFAIEFEILYRMYWGGFLCVFASSLSQVRWTPFQVDRPGLGHSNSVHNTYTNGLPGDLVCLARLRSGLSSDALWNISILPGAGFGSKLDFLLPPRLLTQLILPLSFPLLLVIPFTGFLLGSEIKNSLQNSAKYQMFSPRSNHRGSSQPETAVSDMPTQQLSLGSRVLLRLNTVYSRVRRLYRLLQQISSLPPHGRSGIRLITPVDVENRPVCRSCAVFSLKFPSPIR
jgi:hypothetical protein